MRIAALILMSLVIASCAIADAPVVSINVRNTPLNQAIKSLSDQSGIQILLDSGVEGSVTAELTDMDLEKVIGLITKTNQLKWQKLYAKPDDSGAIPMESVKAQIAALSALQDTPLIVYDPATGQETAFARVAPAAVGTSIDPEKLGLKLFYFISKPQPLTQAVENKVGAKEDPVAKVVDLGKQKTEEFLKLSPDEQRAVAQQDMMWIMSMPPDAQTQFIQGMFGAMNDMDPALRDQLQHSMRDAFRGMRGPRGGRGN